MKQQRQVDGAQTFKNKKSLRLFDNDFPTQNPTMKPTKNSWTWFPVTREVGVNNLENLNADIYSP